MQLKVQMLSDGCCGMAGAFGFEADKYDISVKVGEQLLLPAVRSSRPTALIVADGFSCREQISQLTNRHALHTAEVLQLALHQGPVEGALPEAALVAERERALRRSKLRTLATLGAIAVGGLALSRILRNHSDR